MTLLGVIWRFFLRAREIELVVRQIDNAIHHSEVSFVNGQSHHSFQLNEFLLLQVIRCAHHKNKRNIYEIQKNIDGGVDGAVHYCAIDQWFGVCGKQYLGCR
ncbi:hypothetical protein ACIP86_25965 [Pseudomonas neuropathica]